ncbi:hypothetical protein MEO40_23070, partial [Dolichospermum sp. ST_sed1]|nr:hypothetical protein [Dolichospermum sp. ST_sed1]MDD1443320.1 hypothetical protein [Dolichospermum sp. ST_sed3]MDD1449002.1 hypothetical protein [Dolichospermum sp. ST_sed8]MDD1467937.1 hypothetical protein [Dolichospermum sp. ST_sed5]
DILIQTKYSLNSATIKQYANNNPANPQIPDILIQAKKEGTSALFPLIFDTNTAVLDLNC